jgi:hypothetical protein
MADQPSASSGAPSPEALEQARQQLRQRQVVWAKGPPIAPADLAVSDRVIAAAMQKVDERKKAVTREGELVRDSAGFRYNAEREEARWRRTEEIIRRVSPGRYEDPVFLEMLARQAASIEYVLKGLSREDLSRILLGTTGEPRSEGYSAAVAGQAIIAISAGMMDFMYQTAKAVVLSWKRKTPPQGVLFSFSVRPEDTAEVLAHDPYPTDLFHDTLVTWLYEGRPRAPQSRLPDPGYHPPLALLINGAERFVVAHEYGHALVDQLGIIPLPDQPALDPSAPATPWMRELRADAFAFVTVSESAHELDLLPTNMALEGAVVAMKAHQLFNRAVSIARTGAAGTDEGSASHPPFERRIAQLQQFYVAGHPDPTKAPKDLPGMLAPGQTMEQLWERVAPRLVAYYRAGRPLHPIWSAVG